MILSLNSLLSTSSEIKTAGKTANIPPKATRPIFPPPARAKSELDKDRIKVALRFNNVAEITPTKDIGTAYFK